MDVLRLRAELAQALKAKKVGPRAANRLTGIDPGTVSRWTNIKGRPNVSVDLNKAVELLTALQVPLGPFFARVEGRAIYADEPIQGTSSPSVAETEVHFGTGSPFSADTRDQLTAWLYETLEDAAERSKRLNVRAVMEEMAVAIAETADANEAEALKKRILARRPV